MADLLDVVTAADLAPFGDIAAAVETVARAHGITADPGPIDDFAADVTRLCDEAVTFDRTEMLIIKLTRAGIVDDGQSFALHAAYLAQQRPSPPPSPTRSAWSDDETRAVDAAAQRALDQRRWSGEPFTYLLDGWIVREHAGGRVERLAPLGEFRAEDHPPPDLALPDPRRS